MNFTRRQILKLGISGAAGLILPGRRLFAHGDETHVHTSPVLRPFVDALRLPPVLRPTRTVKADIYSITMKEGIAKCHRDLPPTRIIGYDGLFPGPTIRARKGRKVIVHQQNSLPIAHSGHTGGTQPTAGHLPAVHLHGAVVAPESDGHPDDGIPAGGSRSYTYPNKQRACAMWYHDHTHEQTGRNVYHGLAGLYFLDDPRERALRLPRGPQEVPLVLQDRSFGSDGQLVYDLNPNNLESGVLGDVMLVNGVALPFFEVATRKYRFRILNGSNARIYKLALSNGQPLIQIGTDGGLLQRPVERASIEIAPSERVDVVVDFGSLPVGSSLTFRNLNGAGRTGTIMRFDVKRQEVDDSRVPAFLAPWVELPEDGVAQTREFVLNRQAINNQLTWVINGQAYNGANPPMATPKLGTTEKWRFTNPTTHPHPMHLHLVQFQVTNINGQPQEPADLGWKDTVVVPAGGEVSIIAKFSHYTGRYVFHCHNLEHEDFAMMAEFEVVP